MKLLLYSVLIAFGILIVIGVPITYRYINSLKKQNIEIQSKYDLLMNHYILDSINCNNIQLDNELDKSKSILDSLSNIKKIKDLESAKKILEL